MCLCVCGVEAVGQSLSLYAEACASRDRGAGCRPRQPPHISTHGRRRIRVIHGRHSIRVIHRRYSIRAAAACVCIPTARVARVPRAGRRA